MIWFFVVSRGVGEIPIIPSKCSSNHRGYSAIMICVCSRSAHQWVERSLGLLFVLIVHLSSTSFLPTKRIGLRWHLIANYDYGPRCVLYLIQLRACRFWRCSFADMGRVPTHELSLVRSNELPRMGIGQDIPRLDHLSLHPFKHED